ncbi:hypothetical protein N9N67_10295 [Bacteriovoracaceae bacterium]|nr:hypothetical protein [Bacteriovoracaceae bacterium]
MKYVFCQKDLIFLTVFSLFIPTFVGSSTIEPNLPHEGVISPNRDGFKDNLQDYEKFYVRITDKDDRGNVLKLKVENNNSKFLRVGDLIYFKINNYTKKEQYCRGTVRSVEDFYFSVYVASFSLCKERDFYLKRGTTLKIWSKDMGKRVIEASEYRKQLIMKKDGFLGQLNDINNFLYTYEEQKVKLAAEYDERVNQILEQKASALESMLQKKHESIILQNELRRQLVQTDEDLKHYRIERQELFLDRWNMDHDQGKPVTHRPSPWKDREKETSWLKMDM